MHISNLCMHKYIHTCMHKYIHTCIHTYMHTYIHTYIHVYIHTYMYTYTCTHITEIQITYGLGMGAIDILVYDYCEGKYCNYHDY